MDREPSQVRAAGLGQGLDAIGAFGRRGEPSGVSRRFLAGQKTGGSRRSARHLVIPNCLRELNMQRSYLASARSALSTFGSRWIGFWFTPEDPTLLGLMRILAGLVTLYTVTVHGFTLPQFMGEHAWVDAKLRLEQVREFPHAVPPLTAVSTSGSDTPIPAPSTDFERKYLTEYHAKWGFPPPCCYPKDEAEARFADDFREKYKFDFRAFGLPFPSSDLEVGYLRWYAELFKLPSPPPYPADKTLKAMQLIDQLVREGKELPQDLLDRPDVKEQYDRVAFFIKHNMDPRKMYDQGLVVWSIWLHVTDPFWMNVVQAIFVLATVCMVLGLGTRVAIPIVWFANLSYVHRNPFILFGVDTMMVVLLLYLMIGPSGQALSLDRLLTGRKEVRPLVSAGFTYRLLQIHLSIIYFVSGIAKLLGPSWWSGMAVWNVLANYEFAPMGLPIYREFLRLLGQNQLLFEIFVTGSGYATLAFEIGYPFLMWQRWSRRPMLWGAVFLHGFIGMFMGLKTFSLMMLVFNMAFLTTGETKWILERLRFRRQAAKVEPPNAIVDATPAMAARG
jgi:Vitamin K-dependent gamma-carboxylase